MSRKTTVRGVDEEVIAILNPNSKTTPSKSEKRKHKATGTRNEKSPSSSILTYDPSQNDEFLDEFFSEVPIDTHESIMTNPVDSSFDFMDLDGIISQKGEKTQANENYHIQKSEKSKKSKTTKKEQVDVLKAQLRSLKEENQTLKLKQHLKSELSTSKIRTAPTATGASNSHNTSNGETLKTRIQKQSKNIQDLSKKLHPAPPPLNSASVRPASASASDKAEIRSGSGTGRSSENLRPSGKSPLLTPTRTKKVIQALDGSQSKFLPKKEINNNFKKLKKIGEIQISRKKENNLKIINSPNQQRVDVKIKIRSPPPPPISPKISKNSKFPHEKKISEISEKMEQNFESSENSEFEMKTRKSNQKKFSKKREEEKQKSTKSGEKDFPTLKPTGLLQAKLSVFVKDFEKKLKKLESKNSPHSACWETPDGVCDPTKLDEQPHLSLKTPLSDEDNSDFENRNSIEKERSISPRMAHKIHQKPQKAAEPAVRLSFAQKKETITETKIFEMQQNISALKQKDVKIQNAQVKIAQSVRTLSDRLGTLETKNFEISDFSRESVKTLSNLQRNMKEMEEMASGNAEQLKQLSNELLSTKESQKPLFGAFERHEEQLRSLEQRQGELLARFDTKEAQDAQKFREMFEKLQLFEKEGKELREQGQILSQQIKLCQVNQGQFHHEETKKEKRQPLPRPLTPTSQTEDDSDGQSDISEIRRRQQDSNSRPSVPQHSVLDHSATISESEHGERRLAWRNPSPRIKRVGRKLQEPDEGGQSGKSFISKMIEKKKRGGESGDRQQNEERKELSGNKDSPLFERYIQLRHAMTARSDD